MKSSLLKTLATITVVLGIITLVALVQPLVFPEVQTGTVFNRAVFDNQFSFPGLISWLGIGFGYTVVYATLSALATILDKLK